MTSFLKEERGALLRNHWNLVLVCSSLVVFFLVSCVEQIVGKKTTALLALSTPWKRIMQLIPLVDLKKGSTSPQCLKIVLASEFANCALGLIANLSRHAMLTELAALRPQMITTSNKEEILVAIPKRKL
jgi:hypothetical protein